MDISANSTETRKVLSNTNWGEYDALIHTGDFAYDIIDNDGKRGDDYFNELKDVNTKIPYLVTPGNHENFDKTNLFNYRFKMANSNSDYADHSNNFWTIKLRNTQLFFVNYDYIFDTKPGSWKEYLALIEKSFKLSKQDPNIIWRIVLTHRPIVCSDD